MKFIKSVIQTMKDTTWLNAKETRRDTTTVVVLSLAFAVFFGVVDYAAQALINLLV
ncbi:preprotein translocase subunit SecE [Ligilactobacillus faecis]|uniref:Preprotein translocase subunit SecE n=1 Tax=Ligilactobacillus faecis TaxID=762833 RepID=A0ABV4DN90_9LACO|nr:preprotein translocase subunit SecE [Ligilactobacillus faecis]WGN88577.1 preprotein translocase subunit SecE [Ligilactobacillus faecis]